MSVIKMASGADDVDNSDENNILYDLTIHAEWPQEPESFTRAQKEKTQTSVIGRLASATQRSVWTSLRTLGLSSKNDSPCSLPPELVKLVNGQINWHVALSSDGNVLSVVQDQCVEIRTSRDEYGTVVGRGILGKDPYPQWRKTAWSLDSTMVACSSSTGRVTVFDVVGTQLMSIPGESPLSPMSSQDLSRAVASLVFMDSQQTSEWSAELLVINYHGTLKRYLLDREKGYKLKHTFQFSSHYPLGVSALVHHPGFNLLLLGGCGDCSRGEQSPNRAVQEGITAWRILSDAPHYKLVTDYSEDLYQAHQHSGVMKRLKNFTYYSWYGYNPDGVFKMCLSPNGQILVTIHHSGKLCLWDVPSLRRRKSWLHEEQPDHNQISPDFEDKPMKRKVLKDMIHLRTLIDVNWWSEKEMILARCSGAVSVSSIQTLKNLLGTSPEWFEPSPHVTNTHDGGFISLECECQFPSLKRRLVATEEEEYDDSDDEDTSMVTKTTKLTKQVLYYITDSDRFQPPRKRPRLVTRTYRLVRLKSTTPEELYDKKINCEEYGEALALARTYGLDCDKVYQRQWRKAPVSVASIQDYLSKISKRSWVLHECLERVPENIDAMKELLEYGLRGTDLQALISIGKGEDGGRFILCDLEEEYEDIYEEPDEVQHQQRLEQVRARREELLKQMDFNSLSLEQKQLCKDRLMLLQYLDRLNTYELILGGKNAAEMRFDHKFFEKFRSQNMVEAAVDYARMSDDKAVDILLTFHGRDLREHRLAILSNFPETTSPLEYKSLLPEIEDGAVEAEAWKEDQWRERDWCELEPCRNAIDLVSEDIGASLYEDNPDYKNFRTEKISDGLLTEWYDYRACEIEMLACQVDNSLQLVRLAMERGVQGLTDLYDDLVTMETMVYECGLEEGVVFEELRTMANLQKLQLLLSKSPVDMYSKNVHRWMVPFLERCEAKSPGAYNSLLGQYIVLTSQADLTCVSKLFELSKPGVSKPVIRDHINMMSMALDAVYTTDRDDQLKLATFIFECLPNKTKSKTETPEEIRLNKLVDELERHLRAARILEQYGLKQPLKVIKQTQSDPDETKNLMVKLTRMAGRRTPALTENEYWGLLDDVQILQSQVYKCITQQLCLQIYAESLLCSGKLQTINLVGELMERSATEKWQAKTFHGKLTYQTATELVIRAAREYFDSSANLTDPCMDLARACLHLIRDSPAQIQEELDLISSLALLEDFGVSVLPLQVRLSKDRLSLVAQSVETRPNAYKQSEKLLRLGHLLRIPGETQVDKDGQVLHLVVNTAIKNKDYTFAYEICESLMIDNYDPIWPACRDLAEQVDFRDIRAKAELLSFAVTYCDPPMIEPILKAKCLLETQILCDTVTTQMESQDEAFVTPRSSPFSTSTALQQTQELLSSTTQTTKQLLSSTSRTTRSVLSTVTDTKWWQKTLTSLKQPSKLVSQPSVEEKDDGNVEFLKQGCPEFYTSVINNAYVSKNKCDTGEITMSENLLRTARLEELLTEGTDHKPSSEVILQLSRLTIQQDAMLGIAYLLSLAKAEDADDVLQDLPSSAISLHLSAYFYALQIYSILSPYVGGDRAPLYNYAPSEVIQKVTHYITNTSKADRPEDVQILVGKFALYTELLEDYNQAKVLQGLGRGVDVVRFTEDKEYKHETILGLAMCLEDEVFNIAVSLAKRYNLSLWEIYMTHLEFLFCESGLSVQDVKTRTEHLGLPEKLSSKAEDFYKRMEEYVLPSIEGSDHGRLLYYYTLLSGCQLPASSAPVAPDVHIKLLKKLKSATPGLDYKNLMDSQHEPMDVIQAVLNSNNVHVLAKLANKIPNQQGGYLEPSVVFASWTVKLFWEGDQSHRSIPETTADWVHRYEACGDFVQRLSPGDLLHCASRMLFSRNAHDKLSHECRNEIIKRMLKVSRQQAGKAKKMDSSGDTVTWEDAVAGLQQLAAHLQLLTSETIQSMALSTESRLKEYAVLYDISGGNVEKLKQLLVQMMLDGVSADLVEDVLSVSPVDKWTPRTALQQAVAELVSILRDSSTPVYDMKQRDPLDVLKGMVTSVQEHQEAGGDLVSSEDMISLLRHFCADSSVPTQPRLDVLEVLEKSFPVSEEDKVLLTLYRTTAIVSTTWPDKQVSDADVTSEGSRQRLFDALITDSSNVDQYLSLSKLLQLWPSKPSSQASENVSVEENPWVRLFTGLVSINQPQGIQATVHQIKEPGVCEVLSPEVIQYVSDLVLGKGHRMSAVKIVLLSSHQSLYSQAIAHLEDVEVDDSEEELVDLILKRRLVAEVVEFPVYQKVIGQMLQNQVKDLPADSPVRVEVVVNQLQQAGFTSEAGSLLLQCRGTHPILQTFSAARRVLHTWLK